MARSIIVVGLMSLVLTPSALPQRFRLQPLRELERLAAQDSLDPDAHYRLALGYARAKRLDDEARALRHALEINPRYAPAYVALALQVYRRRPQLTREMRDRDVPPAWRDSLLVTRRFLHRAFLIDPLAEMLPPDVDPASARFFTALMQGSIARRYGGQARDSLPLPVLWFRGLAAGQNGRYAAAIEDIRVLLRRAEAIEHDSIVPFSIGTSEYRYLLAVLSERNNRPADAVKLYQETLTGDLGHYMAHIRLARLYGKFGMWNEAVMEAQRAVDTNSEDPTLVRELGEIFLAAGRHAEAEAALKRAREHNPRDVGAEYVLGVLYEEAGRGAEARIVFEQFLTRAPKTLFARQIADAKQRLAGLPGN